MYGFVFFFLLLHEKIHILKKICLWEVQTFLKLRKKIQKLKTQKNMFKLAYLRKVSL